jgi:drug/metabolite transporter (DMT)-like permease
MLWGTIPVVALAAAVPEHIRWTFTFVGSMTFIVLFSQAFGWVLWLFIVARLPAGVAGIASLATPVLVVTFAALQLREIPTPHELIGMALIVVALVVNALPSPAPAARGNALRA